MADMAAQNPISCEPCRQKKCKCDRILPICTQCSTTPSRCIYPESGKRGLPQGYITHLEHRLIDTELALYTLYTQLRTAGLHTEIPAPRISASVPDALARRSRTTNMAEWEKYPLRDARDWERWWTEKRVLLGGEEPTGAPHVPGGEASSVTGSREGGSGAAEGQREMESNAAGSPVAIRRGQQAEKLARAEANVYF